MITLNPALQARIKNNLLLVDKGEMAVLATQHNMTYGKFVAALDMMGIKWDLKYRHKQKRTKRREAAAAAAAAEFVARKDKYEITKAPLFDITEAEIPLLHWRSYARRVPYIAYDRFTGDILGVYNSRKSCIEAFGYNCHTTYQSRRISNCAIFIEPVEEAQKRLAEGGKLFDWPVPVDISNAPIEVHNKWTGELVGRFENPAEAAKALGYSEDTVRTWVRGDHESRYYDVKIISAKMIKEGGEYAE